MCVLSVAGILPSVCQPSVDSAGVSTNLGVYQELAISCIVPRTDAFESFRLDADERMPYLVSALHERWSDAGQQVYIADSVRTAGPLLRYRIGDAGVAYRRIGNDTSERTIRLALEMRITAENGRLLFDDLCDRRYTDRVRTRRLAALQHPAYSETQAQPPPAGRWRRFVEPAVLGAAMGAVVYLFFTVRSGEGNN